MRNRSMAMCVERQRRWDSSWDSIVKLLKSNSSPNFWRLNSTRITCTTWLDSTRVLVSKDSTRLEFCPRHSTELESLPPGDPSLEECNEMFYLEANTARCFAAVTDAWRKIVHVLVISILARLTRSSGWFTCIIIDLHSSIHLIDLHSSSSTSSTYITSSTSLD